MSCDVVIDRDKLILKNYDDSYDDDVKMNKQKVESVWDKNRKKKIESITTGPARKK